MLPQGAVEGDGFCEVLQGAAASVTKSCAGCGCRALLQGAAADCDCWMGAARECDCRMLLYWCCIL